MNKNKNTTPLQGTLNIMFQQLSQTGYTAQFTMYRKGQCRPISQTGAIKVNELARVGLGKIILSSDKTLKAVLKKGILGTFGVSGYYYKKQYDLQTLINNKFKEIYVKGKHVFTFITQLRNDIGDIIELPSNFEWTRNNRITLYQDAETWVYEDRKYTEPLPVFKKPDGTFLKTHNCFSDIYDALLAAKHFIYILSWVLEPNVGLLIDSAYPYRSINETKIGVILKDKASNGVDVRILLWDNRGIPFFGSFAGGDWLKEAIYYFKNSKVKIEGAKNEECGDCYWVADFITYFRKVFFTHHQKIMVMDQDGETVVGFLGGYDIAGMRHSNSLLEMYPRTGNPESWQGYVVPWHDIHAKVE